MKVALIHDYLTQRGGAERVFELLCKRFPDADIYTSVYSPENTIDVGERPVNTTRLQSIPGSSKYFRLLAPFYFSAFEALDLQQYDLIITSTTSFAKSVIKRPDAYHICFCHNITRFLWDTRTYIEQYNDYKALLPILGPIFRKLRQVDLEHAQKPDLYISNSTTVAKRIQETYKMPATTVNYPIDASRFEFSDKKDDFYLVSSRLLGYKKIDVIVEAFNQLGWPLIITGDGPEKERVEAMASPNISFLGYVSDDKRKNLMSRAKAVIVAALEDYGLVPIEANVSGTPVVCYGAGGVLDTQVPGKTGVFFNRQSPASLKQALLEFETIDWDYTQIREHALSNFTEDVFFEKVTSIIESFCKQAAENAASALPHYVETAFTEANNQDLDGATPLVKSSDETNFVEENLVLDGGVEAC